MKDKIFIDTNLWVYLYSDSVKSSVVADIIDKEFNNIVISTQVLTELYNVLTKKKIKTRNDATQIINELSSNFKTSEINTSMVLKATEIANSLQFSIFDSQIIATAIQNNCSILMTEDLQNDQRIESKLRIKNPFI